MGEQRGERESTDVGNQLPQPERVHSTHIPPGHTPIDNANSPTPSNSSEVHRQVRRSWALGVEPWSGSGRRTMLVGSMVRIVLGDERPTSGLESAMGSTQATRNVTRSDRACYNGCTWCRPMRCHVRFAALKNGDIRAVRTLLKLFPNDDARPVPWISTLTRLAHWVHGVPVGRQVNLSTNVHGESSIHPCGTAELEEGQIREDGRVLWWYQLEGG